MPCLIPVMKFCLLGMDGTIAGIKESILLTHFPFDAMLTHVSDERKTCALCFHD